MEILKEKEADLQNLVGRRIAVIGFGSQGRAQAECLRDSGVEVILGLRREGKSWQAAQEAGFSVYTLGEAVAEAEIVHILIPDEQQPRVLEREILPLLRKGQTLSFSHGFSVHFGSLALPEEVDVILVAPKGPGSEVRETFSAGFGVPGLIAVHKDVSGTARATALAMAHGMGLTRAGVLETTFKEEACEDLFGEQAVLCGGLFSLMKAGFEVLTEAGYPPEMAYFETVHEMKLIVDLIYSRGISGMAEVISNTAEWGMYREGPRLVDADVKEKMRETLKRVESGEFAAEWLAEAEKGAPALKAAREELGSHSLEQTGRRIRSLFSL